MPNQQSKTQRLAVSTQRVDSFEKVQLLRTASLGAAGACLVLLTGLLQVADKSSNAFFAATLFICISLPCWGAATTTYETYVLLGPTSLPHLQSALMKKLLTILLGIGGFSLWGSIGSMVAILSGYAAIVFVLGSFIAALFASFTHMLLARWWFRPGGPGANDMDV